MFDPRIVFAGLPQTQDQSFRYRPGRGAHNAILGSAREQIRLATSKPPTRREQAQMQLVAQAFKLLLKHNPEQTKAFWFQAGEDELVTIIEEMRKLKRSGVRT